MASDSSWVAVSKGGKLHFSTSCAEDLGLADGDQVLLAFTNEDGAYVPWVGVVSGVDAATPVSMRGEGEVAATADSGTVAAQMRVYGTKGRTRLTLTGETNQVPHPDTDGSIQMHCLQPPKGITKRA